MKHVYLALLACATLCVQTLSADPIGSTEALRIAQQQYSMENTSVLRAGSFPEFKLVYVGFYHQPRQQGGEDGPLPGADDFSLEK